MPQKVICFQTLEVESDAPENPQPVANPGRSGMNVWALFAIRMEAGKKPQISAFATIEANRGVLRH